MTGELRFFVDSSQVDLQIAKLMRRIAPSGLRVWMRSEAHPILRDRAASRFEKEGDDASGKWEELMASTGAIRLRGGFPPWHPINVRTGRLKWFTLLTYRLASTATGVTLSMPGDGDRLAMSKLRVAQKGGTQKRKTSKGKSYRPTPARPVVALSAIDERLLRASLKEFINK